MSFNISGGFDPNTSLKLHFIVLFLAGLSVVNGGAIALAFSIPAIAWVFARWVFMILSWIKQRAYENALDEWNGRYFEHEGWQVRIFWDDSETWVACADVFQVLGRSPDAIERKKIAVRVGPGHFRDDESLDTPCFSAQGVMKYLASLKEEETRALRRWLERQVFPMIERHRDKNNATFRRHKLDTGDAGTSSAGD